MTERGHGLFLSFEGTDGSGKTTQIRRLVARLTSEGYDVLETAEPGGTEIGRQIRRILLDPANAALDPTAELLLYFASRAQNVAECIRPALAVGRVVITDRYTDSTLVYQGWGRGLGEDIVLALHRIACGETQPALTLYLDIDLETSLERARVRNEGPDGSDETRMDDQSFDFHRLVRAGYQKLAAREPGRIAVIDARPDADSVEAAIWRAVQPQLRGVHVR
jgi:dTMP kinase